MYQSIGKDNNGYGWAGMTPSMFAARMKLANAKFKILRPQLGIDAIAFSGSSGCAIAFNLASRHDIPLIYVRKTGEKSHGSSVEITRTDVEIKKYLIVDDFVDTGSTVFHIIDSIKKYARKCKAFPAKPMGVLCYDPYQSHDRFMPMMVGVPLPLFTCNKTT